MRQERYSILLCKASVSPNIANMDHLPKSEVLPIINNLRILNIFLI